MFHLSSTPWAQWERQQFELKACSAATRSQSVVAQRSLKQGQVSQIGCYVVQFGKLHTQNLTAIIWV